jgi:histidinol-phosphate aminotransferase
VPHADYAYDLDAIAGRCTDKTKIIYLANPNNPTGSMFTADNFQRFMERVPEHVLVILDEAYYSYAHRRPDYPDGLKFKYANVIVTRTFSKDYGLAGLRFGFAAGPKNLIRELYKVKLPFEPSQPAQIAALAALDDDEFIRRTVDLNQRMLEKMISRMTELGLRLIPTAANFVLTVFPSEEMAVAFTSGCMEKGLIVRHVKAFGVPEGVRINSGTEEETEFALEVIAEVYEKISNHAVGTVAQEPRG